MRPTTIDRYFIIGATAWFLLFGTVAAFVTHAFTFFPDSRQHHHYIEVLLSGHLPRLTATKINQEEHQPPLYYLTGMPWVKLGEMLGGVEGGVLAVRLWTLLLGSCVITVTSLLARQLSPTSKYIPGLAAVLVGLSPQFFVMSAEVNNDALASLLGSFILLALVRLLIGWKPTSRWNILLGVLSAAAFLTKMSLWPLVVILLATAVIKQERRWSTFGQLLGLLVVVGGWWLGRNTLLYGEPTALQKQKEYFYTIQHQSFLTLSGLWTWTTLLFETYWARWRHFTAGLHYQTYVALKVATVLSMLGLATFVLTQWRKLQANLRQAYLGLAACFFVIVLGVFSYNLNFYQPQGRYLWPAQAAIAFFLALGFDTLVPDRFKSWMAGAVFIGFVLFNISAIRVLMFWG